VTTYGFAHRGGSAHGPDNRIETFATALERGAQGLETDAWLTADGEVVLDHDGVHRVAALRRIPMSRVRRDQLPPHLPTLPELYAACGTDFDLAIDVKSAAIAMAVEAVAVRHDAADRLWLVTPHSALLAGVRRARRAVTVKGVTMRSPRRGVAFRAIRDGGAEAVNTRWGWWRPALVSQAHDLGLLAFGYDAQRMTSLRRCVELGLDGVFSDHVDRMVEALRAATPP